MRSHIDVRDKHVLLIGEGNDWQRGRQVPYESGL